MATQEEINAAYELVYETEQAMAVDLLAKTAAFIGDLDAMVASLPNSGSNSTVGQQINNIRSQIQMQQYGFENLKNVYGLNPPMDITL